MAFNKHIIFLLFVATMCLLSNFMGPSLAVLILPNLAYTQTEYIPQERFGQLLSATPPTTLAGCNQADVHAGFYNCSYAYLGESLNAIAADAAYSEKQGFSYAAGAVLIPEDDLLFAINSTVPNNSDSWTIWAPIRQVIDELSDSYVKMGYSQGSPSDGSPQLSDAFNSLELYLQLQGPIIGYQYTDNISKISTTTLDGARQIRCYHLLWLSNTTQCYCVGEGWEKGARWLPSQ